ncbi:phosphoserine phosphatase SerB [Halomonas sp. PAMB 3264]|uniref:phosphoserine phosphatase SerB n=1 Tax=Halomonas sp. PAMB 3264 TaxID=3075222 RepID=UPI0028A27CF0|nr:phosphoserine phosphatase SerB [Halomonas sp. PAMB 3264]WNL43581.1 phosphoserine phosphatase SerB [Halomonas sp. PAMB 3264]
MARSEKRLTVLAPVLTPAIESEVAALMGRFDLTEQRATRLASRGEGAALDAIEYVVSAPVAQDDPQWQALRHAALEVSEAHPVDIVLMEAGERAFELVCFDMDSTLIKAEVIDELAKRHGVGELVAEVTERAMRGELDFKASFRERMAKLEGLSETVLESIALELPLMDGAERLMKNLKRLGYRTAILSGGFTYFARHLQTRLGFDEIHANELVIRDGLVTGETSEPIVDAERKALLLEEIAHREGLSLAHTVAVGDGANDLKMLAKAGMGVAYHAKPLVRAKAQLAVSTVGLDGLLYLLGHAEDALSR